MFSSLGVCVSARQAPVLHTTTTGKSKSNRVIGEEQIRGHTRTEARQVNARPRNRSFPTAFPFRRAAQRVFSRLLSEIAITANDVTKLPPEFSRAERFDSVFFLDLPGREEKQAIWNIYLEQFEIDRDQRLPNDTNWTGAEVKACCRLAALLDMPLAQAAQNIVPVAVTSAESVERLRSWASGRCLAADKPSIYKFTSGNGKTRRKIPRDPSLN
jgi:SpoVK/Ycf46/Vps4 family AAA+-type ATPase